MSCAPEQGTFNKCFAFMQEKTKEFPGGSVVKNLPSNTGDVDSIPGLGWSSGSGNLLQDSCLGNPTDSGAWWAAVHGVAKESGTT